MTVLYQMGVEINGKHSYRDFGLYISSRSVGFPERKFITATVPYMSGYYDFSCLCGGPYYGSRELKYSFDLMADTPSALESLKNQVYTWAAGAAESKIYDDDDPDYYYIGSLTDAVYTPDDDLPECGGEIALTFTCQPYRRRRSDDQEVL